MVTVKDISDFIDLLAPYSTKCEWDNCGILVGDESKEVHKIGFALDLTSETLRDAIENKVDLIVTHHPIIFKAQKNFLKGNLAYELASHGISAVSAHTCFDCAVGGVNDILCNILDIKNAIGVPSQECVCPMARIGDIEEMSSADFANKVAKKLGTVCRVADSMNMVKKVAVCGGAGMDFFFESVKMGADAYVTGEVKHHEFLMAKDVGVTVIEAGHFETENPSMAYLKKYIEEEFPDVETVLLKQSNPVKFID
ncbi:MAG: Nif3-like dinuclear metal center hexameric protein [Clostridia bacterium]|nr:Nif3-like dinuclear metal center hexameric protein [Clostridia bacterium]